MREKVDKLLLVQSDVLLSIYYPPFIIYTFHTHRRFPCIHTFWLQSIRADPNRNGQMMKFRAHHCSHVEVKAIIWASQAGNVLS